MDSNTKNTEYADQLARLAGMIGHADIELEACTIASQFGVTEDQLWTDVRRHHAGAAALNEAEAFIRRFCAFPSEHALVAVTLWAAMTHMVKHFYTNARLLFSSPEAESGKTRALEVLNTLVAEPMFSLSASPAAIFRTLAERQVTLLFDEVDTIWSKRGKDDNHEDLRALLNAGYKRGATIPRCVGPKHDIVHFSVYCAVALAGLGDLPDTIMTRSIIIRMRRRRPDEYVEPFRIRTNEPEGHAIRDRLAAWADQVGPAAGEAWPELPPGIVDRPAEVWEPLIAIADIAGGDWPARARTACVELCKVSADRRASLGVRLLADLRIIFHAVESDGRRLWDDADALHTATILERLVAGNGLEPDAPWSDLRGKPLTVRGLASMLKPYGIHPKKVWSNEKSLQGYRREHLHDAWSRYLPPLSAETEGPEVDRKSAVREALAIPDLPYLPETRTAESAVKAEL